MINNKMRSALAILLIIGATLSALSCAKDEGSDNSDDKSTTVTTESPSKEEPKKDPDFNAPGVIKQYDENENLILARIEVSNSTGNIIKATEGHFEKGALVFYTETEYIYDENAKMLAETQNSYYPERVLYAAYETVFTYDNDGRQITKTVSSFDKDKKPTKTVKYFYEYGEDGQPIESFFEYDKDGNLINFSIPEN